MNRPTKIVALTNTGRLLAKQLSSQLEGSELWFKPKPFAEKIQHAFTAGDGVDLIHDHGTDPAEHVTSGIRG